MQEVVGLRLGFYKQIVTEFTEFSESHLGKIPICPFQRTYSFNWKYRCIIWKLRKDDGWEVEESFFGQI